jgi:hypothetical protein
MQGQKWLDSLTKSTELQPDASHDVEAGKTILTTGDRLNHHGRCGAVHRPGVILIFKASGICDYILINARMKIGKEAS